MTKIFIDSSVLIEFQKNNKEAVSLIDSWNKEGTIFFINPIVVSEVVYILKKKLKLNITVISEILQDFHILAIDNKTVTIAYDYMKKYNMKPNDALILASCKHHKIPNLITIDNDFTIVCKTEEINLLK
jgi:uncharacterized protein